MIALVLLCYVFTIINGEFIFPKNNDCGVSVCVPGKNDILYADTTYNISWNVNNIGYEQIYLLHKNKGVAEDRLSIYNNGTDILNKEIENKNNFMWKIPYDLNRYNLDNHFFRFAVGKKNIFQNVLGNVNNVNTIYSDYFKIETNMNVSLDEYMLYPNQEYTINNNGFITQEFCIEENKDISWVSIYCFDNNVFVDADVLVTALVP